MDESIVCQQAELLLGESFLRITSDLMTVNDDLDDTSDKNRKDMIELGQTWWKDFKDPVLKLLSLNE